MKKILSLFVKYPFYAKAFIIVFSLFGIFAMATMNKASLPVVESKTISVSVTYQGATPKEMEEGVVTLIENSLRGIPGIKEHSSISRENYASVTIIVKNSYDVDKVLYDIKNGVDAISNFPVGAERPVVSKGRTTTPAAFLTLRAKYTDQLKLNDEAIRVEDELRMSPDISNISVFGLPTRVEMSVEIKESQLEKYGITLDQVRSVIANNNLDIYGGIIRNPNEQIQINLRNRSLNPVDIENLVVIASNDGSFVRIKDIAVVEKKFEDVAASSSIEGDQNVMMMISNLKEENLANTTKFINDYIENYNKTHTDTQIDVLMDFMELLDGQLNILYGNGIMGIILVIAALSLFLSFRTSLWVAWGLPMSFLGMFVVGSLLGISMNMISLFGMILIIGILVDDGIVISENIYTRFEKGETPKVAAIKGTLEVLPAVFISVITTMVAFAPILFVQGSLEMMYEMAIVVILCLLFSLIESVFILPSHLAHKKVLKTPSEKSWYGKIRKLFDNGIKYACDKVYAPFLEWTLKSKVVIMACTFALFVLVISLFAGGRVGFTFIPQINESYFTIDLALKPGTSKEVTLTILDYINKRTKEADSVLISKYKEESFLKSLNTVTGSSFNGIESGEHAGQIYVMLRNLDKSKIGSEEIKKTIAEKIGDIPSAYKFAVGASSRFGAPVSVSLFSRDDSVLVASSTMLKDELSKMSSLYNILDNNQIGSQEVRIRLKPNAYALGFTPNAVMSQIRSAFYGSLAQRIQDGRKEVWFYVRYPRDSRTNTTDLENLKLRSSDGGEYPLYEICELYLERSVTKINHYNGQKEIRVDANMIDPNESVTPILEKVSLEILPKIMEKYPSVSYLYQGQIKDSTENTGVIAIYFGVAFIIIALILMIYFRSFLQGFLVLSIIPLSFLAAILGHYIENIPVSMMSIWGMIALSGTIINNAVVFLSRYNDCLKEGLSVHESIIETGKSRFRPIILTSLTTTLGLFPLIRETSSDATMIIPMAVSLGYGILLGTIFILAVFPTYIKLANLYSIFWAKLMGKKDVTPENVEVAVIDKEIDERVERNYNRLYTDIKAEKNEHHE